VDKLVLHVKTVVSCTVDTSRAISHAVPRVMSVRRLVAGPVHIINVNCLVISRVLELLAIDRATAFYRVNIAVLDSVVKRAFRCALSAIAR